MKALLCLVVAHLCLGLTFAEDSFANVIVALENACNSSGNLILSSKPNNLKLDSNNCNEYFNKAEWQTAPSVSFPEAKPDKTYTLLFIDPDVPKYAKGQYFLHGMVTNIKGEDFAAGDLSKANHITEYFGPGPTQGSGIHRYIFAVFEEATADQKIENPGRRSKFDLAPWMARQQKLSGPVASIQFRTEF